jgi:hypothetical protein
VEPPGAAGPARLGPGGPAPAAGRADGRQRRPRPQGAGVLRAAGAPGPRRRRLGRAGLAALRRRPAGQRPHHRVPGLVLRPTAAARGAGAAAGLGQRLLARQQGGARLDPGPQPPGQARRAWRADRRLLPAVEEPVAERDRAHVGPQQAPRGRARPPAVRPGAGRPRLRRLRLPALPSPRRCHDSRHRRHARHCRQCGLIVHWAAAPRTATANAADTFCETLTMPDASPASCAATSAIAIESSGVKSVPPPRPTSRNPRNSPGK